MRSLLSLLCIVTAATAIPLAGGVTGSKEIIVTPGNFACYSAGFNEFATRRIQLTDRFGSGTALVGRPSTLCSPASVSGVGMGERYAYLACHPIKFRLRAPISLTVSNRFGDQKLTLREALTLCVPSSTAAGGALRMPPTTLDNFTCYLSTAGAFKKRYVLVSDAFKATRDLVTAPTSVCAPAVIDTTSRPLQNRVLACYDIDSRVTANSILVGRSKFGLFKASVGTRDQLCLPS
jgi:hypothetical protein